MVLCERGGERGGGERGGGGGGWGGERHTSSYAEKNIYEWVASLEFL